ncbi:hypothetical protein N7466_007222 [Penicillium verhagenii]|uniref:uncharacterized protein n=1 Tax=Penicillium verhagenii TaxID=1562060 RepID=UPI0025457DC3|nr:uncharacterized protein N7466_007222 [Penicillium verhagenii]KAJ5928266.1 hypothetical protein N7466_007222 [Penicillium verhagenii]
MIGLVDMTRVSFDKIASYSFSSSTQLLSYNTACKSSISLFYLFCTGSLFFDIVHHLLHRCNKSSHPLFQRLARVHRYHHLYFTRHMQFDKKYLRQNQFQALPLELVLQVIGTILGYIFAVFVTPKSLHWITRHHLYFTVTVQVLRTSFVIATSGRDSNHLVYETAPKDPNWIFVGPEFHSLHHVYPDRYIGSFIKILDWIFGTAYSFRSKHFVITGADTVFGQAMMAELERDGVNHIHKLNIGIDWDHDQFEEAIPVLSKCDILILAHGSSHQDEVKSDCESAIQLVKLFKKHRATNPLGPTLPEVWYTDNGIESHTSWKAEQTQHESQSKQGFLLHARSLYNDATILYRHIDLSSVHSAKGSSASEASRTAKCAMWWIRRGARYVPSTCIWVACLNYFKFIFCIPDAQDFESVS